MELKFKPKEPTIRHDPPTYCGYNCTPRGGTRKRDIAQKNPQYTYNIKVTVNSATLGNRVYTGTIQMDQTDMLRQEHINHIISANMGSDLRVPKREEFIAKNTLPAGEWGSKSATDPYAYDYVLNDGIIDIWNAVSTDFATARQSQYQGYDVPANALQVTSAYRNPERNEIVGGDRKSLHMLGRAIDIGAAGSLGKPSLERSILFGSIWQMVQAPAASWATADGWLLEDNDIRLITQSTDMRLTEQTDKNKDNIFDDLQTITHIHLGDKL